METTRVGPTSDMAYLYIYIFAQMKPSSMVLYIEGTEPNCVIAATEKPQTQSGIRNKR